VERASEWLTITRSSPPASQASTPDRDAVVPADPGECSRVPVDVADAAEHPFRQVPVGVRVALRVQLLQISRSIPPARGGGGHHRGERLPAVLARAVQPGEQPVEDRQHLVEPPAEGEILAAELRIRCRSGSLQVGRGVRV
jgi:hypothetical protein